MTKRTRVSPGEAYSGRLHDTRKLLAYLDGMLVDHAARQAAAPNDYGYADELLDASRTLVELAIALDGDSPEKRLWNEDEIAGRTEMWIRMTK
jgi:hypothetical protein